MARLVRARSPAAGGGLLEGDDYLTRVAKYVPSEVVAAYLGSVNVLAGAAASWRPYAHAAAFSVCLAATPLYLVRMARPGQPRRMHVAISTLAFVLWAYAIGEGVFARWHDGPLAGALLILFTLVSGLFQPKERGA
jgi:hypothetical protein